MTRIAIVVNSFPKTSESFIVNKVRLLLEAKYEVTVVAHHKSRDPLPSDLKGKVQVRLLPSAYGFFKRVVYTIKAILHRPIESSVIFFDGSKLNFLRKLLLVNFYFLSCKERFDIIHFEFSGIGIAYIPIFKLLKKRSLLYVSCRGHAEQIKPLSYNKRKHELQDLFAKIDRVHCVSDDMLKTCISYGLETKKAFVNRPAINPVYFKLRSKKNIKNENMYSWCIVSVGRLHWKKGFDTLLLSLLLLRNQGVEVLMEIAGDGPEREKLVFLAYQLRLSDRVIFRGEMSHDEVRNLLTKADIYVQSSLSEGISNAVMEAMAMELPVVSTDAGGMNELIVHQHNGLLVPILDPQSLANAIVSIIKDENLRVRIASNARKTILRDFTLDRQRKVFEEEYSNSLQNHRC